MILLASQSPQRARLLERAGYAFRVVASAADEEVVSDPDPAALAVARARIKAEGAAVADGLVLGADTVVALGAREFGKPRDRAHALEILTALSGTTHRVITGHWLLRREAGAIAASAGEATETRVTMRHLSAEDIRAYVDSGESDGRAGAYAIQERGDRFVMKLEGPWDSVVGLHVEAVARLHERIAGGPPELLAPGF
jgi:septum formation protein